MERSAGGCETTEQKKEMTENRYRGGKAVHKAGGRDNGVLSVG